MAEPTAIMCRDCGVSPRRSTRAVYCEGCYLKGDRAYAVQYQARNRAAYRERSRQYMAQQRRDNPALVNDRKQRSRYGLAAGEYDQMRAEQNYCCALCGAHERSLARPLMVDHDHECCGDEGRRACGRCNRRLLCGNCNWMLGLARDNPAVLRAAADYIEKFRTDRESHV